MPYPVLSCAVLCFLLQIVVPLGFLIAQVTKFSGCAVGWIVSNDSLAFILIGLGLPIIVILLVFAQLSPQILADRHKLSFLQMRGSYAVVYLALAVESLGVTQATFVLIDILARAFD